jgi:hypothetical protein
MTKVSAWYLEGIDFSRAPSSLASLRAMAHHTVVERVELAGLAKWEPRLQGKSSSQRQGWVQLGGIARFRRGIATGANNFFLLSEDRLRELGIDHSRTFSCVGRAADVEGLIFSEASFDKAEKRGAKVRLLNLTDPLTSEERRYVAEGEADGLLSRYILAHRSPWYSMEQRDVAPLWAAVFGRGDLKFVVNESGARSLTNFHCIYPEGFSALEVRALALCLNSPSVRLQSKLEGRVYGGGLNKFEPNDLKKIMVPDVRQAKPATLLAADDLLRKLDAEQNNPELLSAADLMCEQLAKR